MPKKGQRRAKQAVPQTSLAAPVELAVLLIQDVKITKGKTCAQIGHATAEAVQSEPAMVDAWKGQGHRVAFFKMPDYNACKAKIEIAQNMPMAAGFVRDAGHTQVDPGTVTLGWILGESFLIAQLMEGSEQMQ